MMKTEPCTEQCGRCDDDGNILVVVDHHDGKNPQAEHERCDVCGGDRVGNMWTPAHRRPRILEVWVDDPAVWGKPFVSEDLDDAPRTEWDVRDLPDILEDWPYFPKRITNEVTA